MLTYVIDVHWNAVNFQSQKAKEGTCVGPMGPE